MLTMDSILRFCLFVCCIASAPLTGWGQLLTHPVNAPAPSAVPEVMDGWQEEISSRTATTARWVHPDGRIRMESSSRPIHYTDGSGQWQRIQTTPEREGGLWLAARQPFPVAITASGEAITGYGTPHETTWGSEVMIQGQHHTFRLSHPGSDPHEWLSEPAGGITKSWYLSENSVKYGYILQAAPLPSASGEWIITESLRAPEGSLLRGDDRFGKNTGNTWMGDLVLEGVGSMSSARIRGALCYDATGQIHLARYSWEPSASGWMLRTHVDMDWLLDPSTVYPVTIDPLIFGPTSTWGDDFMPSCVIPEFNVDSLLVQVPGEITVTALRVTASFYADPFTFALMEDGAMSFSTMCGETDLFEVQPPNGNLPGTAYLENFDLRPDLMCCFTPSCSQTSFWLRMNLGRYIPAGDCNTNYIYYAPFSQWPFSAFIEGHTVETAGLQWTVSGTPQCSNECEFNGTIRARYGVRPYTFTHPWSTETVVTGGAEPCQLNSDSEPITLSWPACPVYCPNFDEVVVPAALITDACGNTVTGIPPDILNIKPTPEPDFPPPPILVCTGETVNIGSCLLDATINWAGNGTSGSGGILIEEINAGNDVLYTNYDVFAEYEGCESPVTNIEIGILPQIDVQFTTNPEPAVVGIPLDIVDQTDPEAGTITGWTWTLDGEFIGTGSSVPAVFENTGTYTVCLTVTTSDQCIAELCGPLEVIPAEVVAPNIFTPNNDGKNDTLEFLYLEFLPDNHLVVRNRWGGLVFEKSGYRNTWDGDDLAEGVYYYVLTIEGREPKEGYIHLTR